MLVPAMLGPLCGNRLAAQPPSQSHLEARRTPVREPSARVRGDTLVVVLTSPVPRPAPLTGATDSLVFLFARDTVYQLEGGRRFVYPPGLWLLVRGIRAVAADTVGVLR